MYLDLFPQKKKILINQFLKFLNQYFNFIFSEVFRTPGISKNVLFIFTINQEKMKSVLLFYMEGPNRLVQNGKISWYVLYLGNQMNKLFHYREQLEFQMLLKIKNYYQDNFYIMLPEQIIETSGKWHIKNIVVIIIIKFISF